MIRSNYIKLIATLLASTLVLSAHAQNVGPIETGTFHGQLHSTTGRAAIYQQPDGKRILRLTNFKTSNGPDVHVILIAAKDAQDNENFLNGKVERVELGNLKGNEGDQNYHIPAGTNLSKFRTVSIYCERFNANFGAAPLDKF
jgi:hypothetical protein